MRISEPELSNDGDFCRLQALVTSAALREPFLLWYRFPSEAGRLVGPDRGSPWLAALLVPAMRAGETLEIPVPVSEQLLRSTTKLQYIFNAWDRTLSKIDIKAPLRKETPPPGAEVGLFFSSGVDSFYSLLKNCSDHPLNEDRITHLVTVHGLDIEPGEWKNDIYARMLDNTHRIAAHLDKGATGVATNFKDLMALLGIPWALLAQGAALASVGLFLEGGFRKFYMATGMGYAHLIPDGVHPLLDPLWSTESCTFVHDGCEATRLERIRFIAHSQLAMDNLRVCWARERPEYNCGRCSKCLRTMISLQLAGALGRCRTLPDVIDLNALRNARCLTANEVSHTFPEVVAALGRSEAETEIKEAAREALEKSKRYFEQVAAAAKAIDELIPLSEPFILVDQDTIRERLGAGRRVIPFLERDGRDYGKPADGAVAVRELERLRTAGAKFMVFWWADFWWLDYYAELNQHLRSKYRCLVEGDSVIVFDLGGPLEPAGATA